MIIVAPDAYIVDDIDYAKVMQKLEMCGRVCYKSESKICDGSADKFIANIISRGHEAVLEHVNVTAKFITDRGVSHEIVRHRMASYCQESTRYVNYGNADNELTFIKPCFFDDTLDSDNFYVDPRFNEWIEAMHNTENAYLCMIENGATPQEARSVLPNSTKTELVMTANIREWRHFFKLRTAKAAHPQMREVAIKLLIEFQEKLPALFNDIDVEP